MARRISPFSERTLVEWIDHLQQATSPDERYRALLAVKSLGPFDEAVAWCRHSLHDADLSVVALAAKQLGELKRCSTGDSVAWTDIARELAARLADADLDVRFEAARSLGRIRSDDESSRGVLLSLLDDAGIQPLMIAAIVTALGERSDLDVSLLAPRYGRLLSHEQAEVRECVSAAVATWERPAALLVEPLLIALDDEEPLVRENAAISLGRAGSDTAAVIAALQTVSTDEDEIVAEAARNSLRQLQ